MGAQAAAAPARNFWLAFAAYVAGVSVYSLGFKLSEVLAWLGLGERAIGVVAGIAGMAVVVARLSLPPLLRRFGTPRVWLASAALLAVSQGALVVAADSVAWVVTARFLAMAGLAGALVCPLVYAHQEAEPNRRGEALARMGIGNFCGIATGALLADQVLGGAATATAFRALFAVAGAMAIVHTMLVARLARRTPQRPVDETAGAPGAESRARAIALMPLALAVGMAFAVTMVFLTRFLTTTGVGGFSQFFLTYSLAAAMVQAATAQWTRIVGASRMIFLGMAIFVFAQLLFLLVREAWHLIFPAVALGAGRALAYPSIVAFAAEDGDGAPRSDQASRILGIIDVGTLVGSPVLGAVVEALGWSALFVVTAAVLALGTVVFAGLKSRLARPDAWRRRQSDGAAEAGKPAGKRSA